jgi:Hypervirulence associated proteins TUDOR domain
MGNRRPRKGEKVQWNSHGSTATGKIEEVISSD